MHQADARGLDAEVRQRDQAPGSRRRAVRGQLLRCAGHVRGDEPQAGDGRRGGGGHHGAASGAGSPGAMPGDGRRQGGPPGRQNLRGLRYPGHGPRPFHRPEQGALRPNNLRTQQRGRRDGPGGPRDRRVAGPTPGDQCKAPAGGERIGKEAHRRATDGHGLRRGALPRYRRSSPSPKGSHQRSIRPGRQWRPPEASP